MKRIILLALLTVFTYSCEDFDGWNIDTKNPSAVPPAFLLTSAEQDLFNQLVGMNVNSNVFGMMVQYWGQTTYQDEASYLLRERDVGGNFWTTLYYLLNDLQNAAMLIEESSTESADVQANQLAMIDLLSVLSWHVLVDTYGYIPYTQALQGNANLVPVYDSGESVYMDLFTRLDQAIGALNSAGMGSLADGDLIYNGDVDSWKMFANSLKLRMALRIADFDPTMAASKAAEAAPGVFGSNADNAAFPYETSPPNTNPNWVTLVQSGRTDYIMAEQFVDNIVPLNDPRSPIFMETNVDPYAGGVYGVNSAYVDYSHIGEPWHTPTTEGIILDYSEVCFMLAEAVERGFIAGDAEMYYNAGVTASIEYWTDGAGDAAAYLAQPSVAYATAGEDWKETIGNQKYYALYGRWEAWSTWRMLDYPDTFTRPPLSELPVPRRYYYPNNEPQLNGANYDAASSAIGGDELNSRVFWDITGQGN